MNARLTMTTAFRSLICVAALSGGLASVDHARAAAPLGTVTIATTLDLTTLDGSQNVTTWHRWVYRNLYDPLISLDKSGKVIPWLAERWERIDDQTWRFHLRKDVKFHNGEPLEASAVKLWLEQAKRPNAQARGSLVLLREARVVDAHTVDIVTDGKVAYLLETIADKVAAIPPKYYQEVGPQEFALKPIGSGPYRFVSWRRGDRVVLEANPGYWGGAPKADQVIFWVVPDASARAAAVLNGEATLGINIAALEASRFANSEVARIEPSPSGSRPIFGGLMYNRPIFKDARVREAVNLAINRGAIVERLLRKYGKPMNQLCALSMPCYNPEVPTIPYDPNRAKKLLDEAKLQDRNILISAPQGPVPQVAELTQVISANLQAIGFNVKVQIDEQSQFSKKIYDFKNNQKDLGDIFIYSFAGGPGSETTIRALTYSTGNWNWSRYSNPKVDELFDSARETFDAEKRGEQLRAISAMGRADYAWLFLYEPLTIWGLNKKVSWQPRHDEVIIVQDMNPAK
ncbi:MAG: ABC transporter substrate-binding protein [Lautropia sp.]